MKRTRQQLYQLLGDLPPRNRRFTSRLNLREEGEHYVLEKWLLDLNGIEPVPALFVRPKKPGKYPTILYNHWHAGQYDLGKKELLQGNSGLQQPAYALELTRRGYAAMAIDSWAFGERRGRTESEIFKTMLWRGQVMWGMMVYDSLRAVDYLCSRPDVDARRLGTMGISMGSTMSWWAAALDERIKVCIDLCCLSEYDHLIQSRAVDSHGVYYFVPNLLKHFTTAQINELIAPRAHLSLAGRYDKLTPPAGLELIDRQLKKTYRRLKAPDAWQLHVYDCGHLETADMRARIVDFLQRWL